MAWRIKEEHLDLAEGLHRIVFENPEVLTREGKPQTHERAIFLKVDGCPYCGHTQEKTETGEIDVEAIKSATLKRLNAHHEAMLAHGRKYHLQMVNGGRR